MATFREYLINFEGKKLTFWSSFKETLVEIRENFERRSRVGLVNLYTSWINLLLIA